jgi:C4-dicarboxylate-specific signal transduction histidine kinase
VTVEAPGTVPPASVDPDRAHQMVTAVAMEALEGTDAITLAVGAEADAVAVTVTSPHPPRERPFAEGGEGSAGGLGLYVTRELARRQGGDLTAEPTPEGGARYVLTLPRAQ